MLSGFWWMCFWVQFPVKAPFGDGTKDSLGRNRNPPTSVKQINSCRERWALIFCLRLGPVTCFVGECASIHICWGCRSQALFLLCFASPLPLVLKYLQTSVPRGEHKDKEPQRATGSPGSWPHMPVAQLGASGSNHGHRSAWVADTRPWLSGFVRSVIHSPGVEDKPS